MSRSNGPQRGQTGHVRVAGIDMTEATLNVLRRKHADSGRLLGGEVLEDHLAEELGIADARDGVEDLEAGETSVGVVVRGGAWNSART